MTPKRGQQDSLTAADLATAVEIRGVLLPLDPEQPMDPAAEHLAPLLGRLTNFEHKAPEGARWSLDNMRAVLALSTARLPSGPLVQVGG